jgi:5-methyltetrahydrofolate--homocysteine methyltransferase
MNELLDQLSQCIEKGKINIHSKIPSDMLGKQGVEEIINKLLSLKIHPKIIIENGLLKGMAIVGNKFREGKIFIPDVLFSAKAMKLAMDILKKEFSSEQLEFKGKVILATVKGDLHNIGKNLVKMILEGNGWQVIDLGVDVDSDKIIQSASQTDVKAIGLSALLTTTMVNMKKIIDDLRNNGISIPVAIGGAPVSQNFADEIKADFYAHDPSSFLDFLNKNIK